MCEHVGANIACEDACLRAYMHVRVFAIHAFSILVVRDIFKHAHLEH